MALLFLYLFVALGISFMCSVLEAVLLSSPMSFISMLEQEGKKGVGAQSLEVFGNEYFAATSAILTLLILILSEIIPKTIGAAYWRQIAIPAARVIHMLVFITYPLVVLSELVTRIFAGKKQAVSVSREEVSAMVTVGAEEGVFEKKENRMIQNLLKLDDITAREIMTPSSVVEMAEESMTLGEFYKNDAFRSYSRIPVYNIENDDYIIGYVLRQTILEKLSEDKFNMRLSDVWEKLLAKKEHISVIIDEYGCFRGIVTMEDVIETMLGTEIVDEKDTVTDMQELAREKWQEQQEQQEQL